MQFDVVPRTMSPDDTDGRTTVERRPRLGRDPQRIASRTALRAEVRALRSRLAAAEERLEMLEATAVGGNQDLKACTTGGRVCIHHGVENTCPYCERGQLREL